MRPGKPGVDKIMVVGDVHGSFHKLKDLIYQKKPKMVLQAGDFGFWPGHNFGGGDVMDLNLEIPIYFCDGNHENHDILEKMREKCPGLEPIELGTNLFYCPRGTVIELPDGRKVLFSGGGDSIDKHWRTPGFDWFHQETLKHFEVDQYPDTEIDIVISHTCPKSFLSQVLNSNPLKSVDISYDSLERVLEKYTPDLWYLGHWHDYKTGIHNNTEWTVLNRDGQTGWWCWLPSGDLNDKK